MYWQTLNDLTFDQFEKGLYAALRDPERGRFMPMPADILHFARPKRTSVEAWSEVERAMSHCGAYRTVQFEDGVTNAVVKDMGGWPWICSQDIDEPWTQKEFERRYESYRLSGARLNEPLPGIHETENRARNFLEYVPAPVMIGTGRELPALPLTTIPPDSVKRLTDGNGHDETEALP